MTTAQAVAAKTAAGTVQKADWRTLKSALDILGDHHEWDPNHSTNHFADLSQPKGVAEPLMWGRFMVTGERNGDKIKLTIGRNRVVNNGSSKDHKRAQIPLTEADFNTLKNKQFVLVNHNIGRATEPQGFIPVASGQNGSRKAQIEFSVLQKDFIVPKTKTDQKVQNRLKLHWLKDYSLVQL